MIIALPRSAEISLSARAAVRGFADQLGERRTADACLLVSELVTNAYRHGHGQVRLSIALHDHVARFAVHDEGDATLHPSLDPGEDGGFGLHLVDRIADRWGTTSAPTHVWFELHTPTRTSPTETASTPMNATHGDERTTDPASREPAASPVTSVASRCW
jgi:anti-sigma regulatory factor (Ser/Thr protein kinase)